MGNDYEGGYAALAVVIRREMAERNMGLREFSRFARISATTLHNCLTEEPGNPSLEMLIKLSEAIHINLCTLIGIAFPHVKAVPSPRLAYLLERIDIMPDAERQSMNLLVDVLLQNPVLSDEVQAFLRLLRGK